MTTFCTSLKGVFKKSENRLKLLQVWVQCLTCPIGYSGTCKQGLFFFFNLLIRKTKIYIHNKKVKFSQSFSPISLSEMKPQLNSRTTTYCCKMRQPQVYICLDNFGDGILSAVFAMLGNPNFSTLGSPFFKWWLFFAFHPSSMLIHLPPFSSPPV